MARLFLLPILSLLLTAATAGGPPDRLLQSTKPSRHAILAGGEKLSHLRFFWHDILSGPKPTAVTVARAATSNLSTTLFGMMNIIDDPLTVGPESSSRVVGRAQGLYASAAQDTVGLMMAMNFAFVEGKYNGSTLTVMGRNQVFTHVREMPVIGGSGLFRFARGYVQAKTHWVDLKSGDAVVEYNCYVLHY